MTSLGTADTGGTRPGAQGQQLERIGWALFLIMIGGLALLPSGLVPEGTWLAGTGLIMIGRNVVRHANGIRVSRFPAVLGIVTLAVGAPAMAGIDLPVLPVLLAAIGLCAVYSALLAERGTP